jgi:hypothetical protein
LPRDEKDATDGMSRVYSNGDAAMTLRAAARWADGCSICVQYAAPWAALGQLRSGHRA